MVRADLLDAIDNVLRRYRNNSKPFGGVQLLLIGDLQQLAPVVKEESVKYWKNTINQHIFLKQRTTSNRLCWHRADRGLQAIRPIFYQFAKQCERQ